jgi:hypothetical protein
MLRVEISDRRPVSVWSKESDSVGVDEYVAAAGSGELKHKNSLRCCKDQRLPAASLERLFQRSAGN